MDAEIVRLKKLANNIRENIVEAIASIGVGHIGGCLSIADVLAVLYGKHMRYDPKNPKMAGRDQFHFICHRFFSIFSSIPGQIPFFILSPAPGLCQSDFP